MEKKYKFDALSSNINRNLQYCSPTSPWEPISPYSDITELQTKSNLIEVNDTKGEISSIGNKAFYNCKKLSSINCPNVSSIGDYALLRCNISSIEIPNIQYIGQGVFDQCSKLSSLSVSESNNNFSFVNNGSELTSKNGIVMIDNNNHNVIWGSNPMCENIILPNDVSSIGETAFLECKKLSSINCLNVLSIQSYAFEVCTNLKSIECSNLLYLGEIGFSFCSSITSLDCPNLKTIGEYAFAECSSLTSIVLSNMTDVTQVETNSFLNCPKPISIYVKDDEMVTKFKENEVWGNENDFTLIPTITFNNLIFKSTSGNEYKFNASASPINGHLQYQSEYGLYINEPYSLCIELQDKDNILEINDIKGEISSIGNWSFYWCQELSSVNCNSVQSIGNRAFLNCYNLLNIECLGVTDIGDYAFNGCQSVSSINCPNVSSIGDVAFNNCVGLKTIILSNVIEVTEVYPDSFNNYPNVISVYVKDDEMVTKFKENEIWGNERMFQIIPVIQSVRNGKWIMYDSTDTEIVTFNQYQETSETNKQWTVDGVQNNIVQFSTGMHSRFIPAWYVSYNGTTYNIDDEDKFHEANAKLLNITNNVTQEKFKIKWFST